MADTLRVDVCYRPLRIGWAVRQGDSVAIRKAMQYSHALWVVGSIQYWWLTEKKKRCTWSSCFVLI